MAASMIGAASSGGRHRRRRRAVMSEINVTPFVDVMLVLLIVFMVSAPLMTMSIAVDLPDAPGGNAANAQKEPLILTLKKSGGACVGQAGLFLGQSPLALTDFESKLRAIKGSGQPTGDVWVSADRDICYSEVASILGRLRAAGFRDASLKIDPPKGD